MKIQCEHPRNFCYKTLIFFQSLVTELGDKIEECFSVRDGDEKGEDGNNERGGDSAPRAKPAALASKATPRRKPAQRRNRRRSSSSPDEVK